MVDSEVSGSRVPMIKVGAASEVAVSAVAAWEVAAWEVAAWVRLISEEEATKDSTMLTFLAAISRRLSLASHWMTPAAAGMWPIWTRRRKAGHRCCRLFKQMRQAAHRARARSQKKRGAASKLLTTCTQPILLCDVAAWASASASTERATSHASLGARA